MRIGPTPQRMIQLTVSGLGLALVSLAGCSQPNSFLARNTTVGMLKSSLSHIEYENQQLRTKVTKLETENRTIENRLVEEENLNGDLSARLDDARDLLSRQGTDWPQKGRAMSANSEPSGLDSSSPSEARTLPAGRSTRKPRKPPFTRIPGRIDDGFSSGNGSEAAGGDLERNSSPAGDGLGPQSWRDDDLRWMPIARGNNAKVDTTPSKVR